jgi:hypothetical protein
MTTSGGKARGSCGRGAAFYFSAGAPSAGMAVSAAEAARNNRRLSRFMTSGC